jgi:hypothetical protein
MTQDIFRHWIKILDNRFRNQNRQVLLLLDNTSSHLEPKRKKTNTDVNKFIIYFTIQHLNKIFK